MDSHRGLLGVATAAFFVTVMARLAVSPLVPDITAAFSVSKSEVGLALTGMYAVYALMQFPTGILIDYVGQRRVILVAMGGISLGCVAIGASPTFPLFAGATVALGGVCALYFVAGAGLLTSRFADTGRALGVHEMGASVAGLATPVVVTLVAATTNWRVAVAVPAVAALATMVAFHGIVPRSSVSRPEGGLRERVNLGVVRGLLRRPEVVFTTVLAMIGFFTWQAFASFFPTFLTEYYGATTAEAGFTFGLVFAITIVGAPGLGWVSDRTGRDTTLVASFFAGVTGYALYLLVGGLAAFVAGTVLLGVGLSWPGVVIARFMDHLERSEHGTEFGLLQTVLLLVSSLGSGVTGALADRAGWLSAYGLSAALLAALVVLLAVKLLHDRWRGHPVV
jgi:predicted MFS family arabinose efflux permease